MIIFCAPASKKPGLGKLATGVAIGKAVAGTVGKAAKGLGNSLNKSATRSGFGNPLSASKQHARDMVEDAMKKADKT